MYCMYCMYCMYLNPTNRVANKLDSLSLSLSITIMITSICWEEKERHMSSNINFNFP